MGIKKSSDKDGLYEISEPFLEVYSNYKSMKLPTWLVENIEYARVYGNKKKCVILKDGRKYHLDNKLNDLTGREWIFFINSVFTTHYPTRGKDAYAHEIRKIHPTPKPPQLMRDIISFFSKENELIFDCFAGVGGTLIGAALCNRIGIGIELNKKYIEAYQEAVKQLQLTKFSVKCGDSLKITADQIAMEQLTKNKKISLLLIDPPYSNMMSRKKTGPDIEVYGTKSTPFTEEESDLGNMSREVFLETLKKIVMNTLDYIKFKGYIVLFIKDLQPEKKELNLLHYEVISKLNEIDSLYYKGMKIWADTSSKLYPYGYPFSFVANQTHQYILVFRKEK